MHPAQCSGLGGAAHETDRIAATASRSTSALPSTALKVQRSVPHAAMGHSAFVQDMQRCNMQHHHPLHRRCGLLVIACARVCAHACTFVLCVGACPCTVSDSARHPITRGNGKDMLRAACYRLQCCTLYVAGCMLQVACCNVACCMLQVACCRLHVACCRRGHGRVGAERARA
jgi:hypothetical protein